MKRCECGCGQVVRRAPYTSKARGWVRGEPIRFVHGHHRRKRGSEFVEDENGCWIWQLATMPTGYGYGTRGSKTILAHRIYYEEWVGPIPPGLHIDHLCRQKNCVNPGHLEAVTCRENLRRGKSTKLSLDEVREICLRFLGGESARALGEEFGVNHYYVHNVARGAEAVLSG